jgi:hypothetical protein
LLNANPPTEPEKTKPIPTKVYRTANITHKTWTRTTDLSNICLSFTHMLLICCNCTWAAARCIYDWNAL